ncbi:MAG: hypothetical protein KDE15_04780 [Erythrobacter sp.]|nr:hypothetical protein [Erythrobacter sp.]
MPGVWHRQADVHGGAGDAIDVARHAVALLARGEVVALAPQADDQLAVGGMQVGHRQVHCRATLLGQDRCARGEGGEGCQRGS